ncbi:putative ribonuclease H-like domain-containing protein, partial [Tanacetum coccineum]
FNTVSTPVNAASASRTFSDAGPSFVPLSGSFPIDNTNLPHDPLMPDLEDTAEVQSTGIFGNAYDNDDLHTYNYPYVDQAVGATADFNNIEPTTVMDVKSAFLYGTIEEEVYVIQPLGFIDLAFPNKVYKVEKALYHLHQAPRAWYETLSTYLLDNGFHRGQIDKTLFIKRVKGDILLVQDKYVADILKKFDFATVKTASTLLEPNKPLLKDEEAADVDVHLYRSMIGSLMYLTASRPDIIYLKGQPKLGLWYPRDCPFELEASTDSDYVGASLDRKSTTGGCQFLGRRLISGQCKKQTIVANSTTEAEYVAATNCLLPGIKLVLPGIKLVLLGKLSTVSLPFEQ